MKAEAKKSGGSVKTDTKKSGGHGVTNVNLKKYGRNLARAKNQSGSK
jgi:hypothetical protein